jgi:hypothetical protein
LCGAHALFLRLIDIVKPRLQGSCVLIYWHSAIDRWLWPEFVQTILRAGVWVCLVLLPGKRSTHSSAILSSLHSMLLGATWHIFTCCTVAMRLQPAECLSL